MKQLTASYISQQNRVADQKIRTLTEIVNSMLTNFSFFKNLQKECFLSTCYILKRVAQKDSHATPQELGIGTKANIYYFGL